MPKRISREEYDQLMTAARNAFVQDMEAAAGDSGKADLANKKLGWAEKAARDAFNQRSGLYKFFDSIPLIGKPTAYILDNIEGGIDKYGRFLGSVRGLFIGLLIAVASVVLSEGASVFFDLGREWINTRWAAPKKSEIRATAEKDATQDYIQHKIRLALLPEVLTTPISFYAVDKSKSAHIINGDTTPEGLLEFLDQHQHAALTMLLLETLPSGATITPFFFDNKSLDVARTDLPEKGPCVIASLDGAIIFIPLESYRSAGLPMRGPSPDANKDQKIHLGQHPEIPRGGVPYYPVDKLERVGEANGEATPSTLLDFLNAHDEHNALTSAPLQMHGPITPFFFHNKDHDVAVVVTGKGLCVIASLDGAIIFIPLDAYAAAGLPLRESSTPAVTERGPA